MLKKLLQKGHYNILLLSHDEITKKGHKNTQENVTVTRLGWMEPKHCKLFKMSVFILGMEVC